jgi:hypothetical protein
MKLDERERIEVIEPIAESGHAKIDVKCDCGQPDYKDGTRDRVQALQDEIIASGDGGGKPEPEGGTDKEGGARHD